MCLFGLILAIDKRCSCSNSVGVDLCERIISPTSAQKNGRTLLLSRYRGELI